MRLSECRKKSFKGEFVAAFLFLLVLVLGLRAYSAVVFLLLCKFSLAGCCVLAGESFDDQQQPSLKGDSAHKIGGGRAVCGLRA